MGNIARINKEILKLAIPSIFANITVPLVGMVDIAVAGHIGTGEAFSSASLIGGIAIGTMLFDLLYWNFGFLRISTGGLTAQAYGRGDHRECANSLMRSASLAFGIAICLIAIQWIFLHLAFMFVKCSPEVRTLAQQYFYIRIWAAPATLMLMAFKGWFIGMQDSVSAMATDLVVNITNIAASIILSTGFSWCGGSWHGLGFAGIAIGTLVAQYSGLLCALLQCIFKYGKNVLAGISFADVRASLSGGETRKFFSMNGDIFIRSICFILIYIGFTIISARFGDVLLATCSIMMKLLMIFSYFTDGFAYAGEAMVGKYIGAKDDASFHLSVRWNFAWSICLAAIFMFVYGFGGVPLLRIMTSDPAVIDASRSFLPWLLLMPVAGCAAFTWDGIFIGATATKSIRSSMVWAAISFFAVWFAGIWFFNPNMAALFQSSAVSAFFQSSAISGLFQSSGLTFVSNLSAGATNESAIHLLMAAYFAHLLARSVVLTIHSRHILSTHWLPSWCRGR